MVKIHNDETRNTLIAYLQIIGTFFRFEKSVPNIEPRIFFSLFFFSSMNGVNEMNEVNEYRTSLSFPLSLNGGRAGHGLSPFLFSCLLSLSFPLCLSGGRAGCIPFLFLSL